MARLRVDWKKYTLEKLDIFIRMQLRRNRMTIKELAELMGMNSNTLYSKLRKCDFDYVELVEMLDIFGTPDDERLALFTPALRR